MTSATSNSTYDFNVSPTAYWQTSTHTINSTFGHFMKLLDLNVTTRSSLSDLDLNDLKDLALPEDDTAFYYSGENIENLLKPWTKEQHFVPTVSIYGVAFLLGLVGNSLVIFAMVGDKKSRSTTATFMVSLAVADLLFLLVCVPYETAKNFIGHWDTGTIFCKVSGAVEMLSALASVLNLMAVSIERYMVIVHPMKARSWCTVENTKKMLPCVWIVALGLSAPTLYVWNTEKTVYYNNKTSVAMVLCADIGVSHHDRLIYAVYQFLIMFVIPVIVLLVCYVFVIHALWVSSRQLLQMTSHDSGYSMVSTIDDPALASPDSEIPPTQSANAAFRQSHIRSRRSMLNKATREHSAEVFRARKQVIKMLITIVLVFLLCWGPKLLFSVFQRIGYDWIYNQWAYTLKIVINVLPFIHSCLNPIIYGVMSKNFRSRMRCACRTYMCPKSRHVAQMDKRHTVGSELDHELDTRSTNGTVHTKISLRHGSSSQSDT